MELGRRDEARAAFEQVLGSAPDNLIALRSMADIHQRREEHREEQGDVAPSIPPAVDPALPELEAWLTAILADRAARGAS